MGFLRKKIRLVQFLTRRIPRLGWAQWAREREMSYFALELSELLPAGALHASLSLPAG